MKKTNFESIAREIYDWCMERELWGDNTIYFAGKAWSSHKEWDGIEGRKIDERLYEYEGKNPLDCFEYANPDTLSMSFEGNLYTVLNAFWEREGWAKWHEDFGQLIEKHGYYYEMGHSWNLSLYEN